MKPRMAYSSDGVQFTAQHEGLRYEAYKDSGGVWTCGYGHIQGVGPSTKCTDELAKIWLQQDILYTVNAINNLVDVTLTQNEFDALVDFAFNIGVGAFAKSSLLMLLNSGKYKEAAEQFDRWIYCKGKVLAGLIRRRNDEELLFNTPEKE